MRDFRDKVAVVTGGSGGIGRGMAERFVAAGMRVVLADLDADGLNHAEAELGRDGGTVLGVPTDVSKRESVEALAQRTLDEFGAVHVLCNNAGLNSRPEPALWELPYEEWQAVDTAATVELNTRDPLLCEPGEFHTVNALVKVLLNDADSPEQGLTLTTTAAPVTLELVPGGAVRISIGNRVLADEVVEIFGSSSRG